MALRSGHGTGAGQPRVEVLPADELPRGVQASTSPDTRSERRKDGTFRPGNVTIAASGGAAKRQRVALATGLGLRGLVCAPGFAPYRRQASAYRRAQCSVLSRSVGGGFCGPGPSAIVSSAAWQLAASRYLFDQASQTGDAALFAQASKLADASRQNLLAAHELCAREAEARIRGKAPPPPWLVPADSGHENAPRRADEAADGPTSEPSEGARPEGNEAA